MTKEIDYKAVLADLELRYANITEQRRTLDAKEQALRASMSAVKRLVDIEFRDNEEIGPPTPFIPEGTLAGLGVVEAAYRYLTVVGTGQSNRELTDGLLRHGFETESKSPAETVRISLKQRGKPMGIFFAQGKWWLLEWPHAPKFENGQPHQLEMDGH
jgi:hypothetical protein